LTVEKQIVESKYDEKKWHQICGGCGYNEFIDTTTTKEKGVVMTTAKCANCGKINLMEDHLTQVTSEKRSTK